jgi:hypothetical protein
MIGNPVNLAAHRPRSEAEAVRDRRLRQALDILRDYHSDAALLGYAFGCVDKFLRGDPQPAPSNEPGDVA